MRLAVPMRVNVRKVRLRYHKLRLDATHPDVCSSGEDGTAIANRLNVSPEKKAEAELVRLLQEVREARRNVSQLQERIRLLRTAWETGTTRPPLLFSRPHRHDPTEDE